MSVSQRSRQSSSRPVVKLLLLGDSGVGKTSLMCCFSDDGAFAQSMISTAGVDCRVKPVTLSDGNTVSLQIWDTAGQERFKTITRQYYRGAMGVMLVFDCTSHSSFAHVDYWLNNIAQFAQANVARILVANKCDMTDKRVVPTQDAQALATHFSIPYFECSAKSNTGVTEAFTALTEQVMPNLSAFTTRAADDSSPAINLAERRRSKEKQRCAGKCQR